MKKWQMRCVILAFVFLIIATALNLRAVRNLDQAVRNLNKGMNFQSEVLELQMIQIREYDRKILFLCENVKDAREDIFSLIHTSGKSQ